MGEVPLYALPTHPLAGLVSLAGGAGGMVNVAYFAVVIIYEVQGYEDGQTLSVFEILKNLRPCQNRRVCSP